jgi:hypothetical protein
MENPFNRQSPFDKLVKEKAEQGWQYVAVEKLTVTKFNTKTATFDEVSFQTEDNIKAKYCGENMEVELVQVPVQKLEDMKKILSPEEFSQLKLNDEDKEYYIFVKEKE